MNLFSLLTDESEDELLCNEDLGKKRKSPYSHSLGNGSRQAKRRKEGNLNESMYCFSILFSNFRRNFRS
jgi:hypothetical protein